MFDIRDYRKAKPADATNAPPFGMMSPEELETALGAFCAGVKSGKIILCSVKQATDMVPDDFVNNTLQITFAQRRP